jgi:hypothetical protein
MQQVAIFTTGGTIDKVYFDAKGGYEVGGPGSRLMFTSGNGSGGLRVDTNSGDISLCTKAPRPLKSP